MPFIYQCTAPTTRSLSISDNLHVKDHVNTEGCKIGAKGCKNFPENCSVTPPPLPGYPAGGGVGLGVGRWVGGWVSQIPGGGGIYPPPPPPVSLSCGLVGTLGLHRRRTRHRSGCSGEGAACGRPAALKPPVPPSSESPPLAPPKVSLSTKDRRRSSVAGFSGNRRRLTCNRRRLALTRRHLMAHRRRLADDRPHLFVGGRSAEVGGTGGQQFFFWAFQKAPPPPQTSTSSVSGGTWVLRCRDALPSP